VQDGYIVAIGGLMQPKPERHIEAKVPSRATCRWPATFQTHQPQRPEARIVFLIKPTVIKGDAQWRDEHRAPEERIRTLSLAPKE